MARGKNVKIDQSWSLIETCFDEYNKHNTTAGKYNTKVQSEWFEHVEYSIFRMLLDA